MSQLDIFGGVRDTDIAVYPTVRKIMNRNPITWKSHRLLMYEVAKELRFPWDKLTGDEKTLLQRLLELSPDFERAARKVREEDTQAAKSGQ